MIINELIMFKIIPWKILKYYKGYVFYTES